MPRLPFAATALVIFMQGSPAVASTTLPELMGDYPFVSGFRQTPACDSMLTSVRSELNKPIDQFRNLPVLEKIKSVHFLADSVFRSVSLVLNDNNLSQVSQLVKTREIAQGVAHRLTLLLPVARESFPANSRELLVILNKLLPLTMIARDLEPLHRRGIIAFHKAVFAAAPNHEEPADHALRALALANLAVMEASLMEAGADPAHLVDNAIHNLNKANGEDALGFKMAVIIEPSLIVFQYSARAVGRFSRLDRPVVDEMLAHLAKAGRHLTQTGAERLRENLAQLDQLLKTPALSQFPQLRTELAAIRAEFALPPGKRPN